MKRCTLELQDNFIVKVVVANADQLQRLKERADSLLPYLRKRLNNSHIDMVVYEAEATVRAAIFSPLDKLSYMASKNPNILTICNELDLEIL